MNAPTPSPQTFRVSLSFAPNARALAVSKLGKQQLRFELPPYAPLFVVGDEVAVPVPDGQLVLKVVGRRFVLGNGDRLIIEVMLDTP
jgi:hypothetical protein